MGPGGARRGEEPAFPLTAGEGIAGGAPSTRGAPPVRPGRSRTAYEQQRQHAEAGEGQAAVAGSCGLRGATAVAPAGSPDVSTRRSSLFGGLLSGSGLLAGLCARTGLSANCLVLTALVLLLRSRGSRIEALLRSASSGGYDRPTACDEQHERERYRHETSFQCPCPQRQGAGLPRDRRLQPFEFVGGRLALRGSYLPGGVLKLVR